MAEAIAPLKLQRVSLKNPMTLSCRSGAFSRAKQKNRDKVEIASRFGKLTVLLNSTVDFLSLNNDRARLLQNIFSSG